MKKTFFNQAKEEMFKSDFSGAAQIGCVVVYHNRILAKSSNTDKTSPLQKKYNKYRFSDDTLHKEHAEIRCLRKVLNLDIDFSKVELYIYRELKNSNLAMCRPCPACMALIKELGIKKIYYTTADGFVKEQLVY